MDKEKLKYYKNKLIKEREKVLKDLENKEEREEETSKMQDRELSNYDNHPADTGTELYMMEQDRAFQDQSRRILAEIDESLKDIENGEYGYCSDCDEMISHERLEIIPYAKTCLKCSDEDKEPMDDSIDPESKEYETLNYSKIPKDNNVGYDQEDVYRDMIKDNIVPDDPSGSTGDNQGLIEPEESDDIE